MEEEAHEGALWIRGGIGPLGEAFNAWREAGPAWLLPAAPAAAR